MSYNIDDLPTRVNLTCLSTKVYEDDVGDHTPLAQKLQMIHEASKPGNFMELSLNLDSSIEWNACDSEFGTGVKVIYDPKANTLTIDAGHNEKLRVVVNKTFTLT